MPALQTERSEFIHKIKVLEESDSDEESLKKKEELQRLQKFSVLVTTSIKTLAKRIKDAKLAANHVNKSIKTKLLQLETLAAAASESPAPGSATEN